MSRRSVTISPAEIDDPIDPTGFGDTLSVMEMGDCEQQQQHPQRNQEPEESGSSVIVAATEARNEEGERREGVSRANQFLAEILRVALVGVVVIFGGYFSYVWVDSFRKGKFSSTLGLITVTFCGLIVCAWVSRMRLRSLPRLPDGMGTGGSMERRPKGAAPPRAQQNFQYFVYPELASSSSGSATSLATSYDGSGVGFSSTTFQASADCVNDDVPDGESHVSGDSVGDDAERGESSAFDGEVAAIATGVAKEARDQNCGMDAEAEMVPSSASPPSPSPLEHRPEKEGQQQEEAARDGFAEDLELSEYERQNACGRAKATEEDSSPWADCSVCLEAFNRGDNACRTPCGHVFHAECINVWLDLNNSCPECRLDLLGDVDDTTTGGESRPEEHSPESSPASSLPDEAYQISFSDRAVSSPSPPTAAEEHPTTFASDRGSTAASTHSDPLKAPHSGSLGRAPVVRTTDLPPAGTENDVTELTTVTDTTEDDGDARTEAPAVGDAATASCPSGFCTQSSSSLATAVVPLPEVPQEPDRQRESSPPSRSAAQTLDETAAVTAHPPSAAANFFLDSPDYKAPISPGTFARQLQRSAVESGRSPFPRTPLTTADVTDLNTAINAIPNDNGASAAEAVAPYACYFDSPCTQDSSSPRSSAVRFLGLPGELGDTTPSSRASRTPERTVAPYANFFNSPGSPSSPVPVSTAMVPFRGSPSGAAAAAPFACYLNSPSNSPLPLSTADLGGLRLSPEFVRLRGAGDARGFRGVPATSPLSPPTFAALSFPRGVSSLPGIGAGRSSTTLVARTQHRQQRRVGFQREDNGDQAPLAPQRAQSRQPQHVPVHRGHHGQIQEQLGAALPPPPPARLVQRRSPEIMGDDQLPPPPPPPPLSYGTPARPTGGRLSGGAFRPRSSPQLVRGGGSSLKGHEAAVGVGRPEAEGGVWVWPVGSDPIRDDEVRVSVGDQVRISSFNEVGGVQLPGGGQQYRDTHPVNQDVVGASSGGQISGRWVWQPGPMVDRQYHQYHQHQHPQQQYQDPRQMMYRYQHDRSFDEESLSEAEEHDERFWDRVMYHIWA